MKIAVIGLDFPLGKRALADQRLEKLKSIFHVQRVTEIQIEFTDESGVKDADGILCENKSKLDLIIRDLEVVENRLASGEGDKELFTRCKEALEKETILNEVPFSDSQKHTLAGINLVTLKPIVFVDQENAPSIPEMMRMAHNNLPAITFFTVNEKELRAWSLRKGASVHEAAGLIHSDIQRGFIKAEITGYEDLIKAGGLNQAKTKGAVKVEDKGYLVREGDLIQIRFNV
jgi:ribosome-binding ATPase YchF (GTP1/OBG family)